MSSRQEKLTGFQNELALLKKFVPALAKVELIVDHMQCSILTGQTVLSCSFVVELNEDPAVLSERVADQLRLMEQLIFKSLDGLKLYDKMRLAHAGEIADAHNKGYCDRWNDASSDPTYWDGFTKGIKQGKEEKEAELYEMKMMAFLRKLFGKDVV